MRRIYLKKVVKAGRDYFAEQFGRHRLPAFRERLWILMYHRVLPKDDVRYKREEPGMCVTPETLDMHLREIKKHFQPIQLSEWIRKNRNGEFLPKKSCAITFDDGWLDNYEFAIPILKKHKIPASIYVVSHRAGTDYQFWPNLLIKLFKNNQDNKYFLLSTLHWVPNISQVLNADITEDQKIFSLIDNCKVISDQEIYDRLSDLGIPFEGEIEPDLMSWQQIKEISKSDLFEIGSHTCHHYRLDKLSDSQLVESEINDSKEEIEKRTGKRVSIFCYPNGNYNEEVVKIVSKNYSSAITTKRGINSGRESLYELKRFGMHEDVSATRRSFLARISGWL